MGKYSICLDIGGTKVLGAVFNKDKKIIYRLKKKTKAHDGFLNVENSICSVVEELLEKSKIDLEEVDIISAGAPGVIDQKEGMILFSPNLPWENYPIRQKMQTYFKKPFFIGNDVNVGTFGEWKYGAAKGYSNVIGLFLGTGIGGGLILENSLYTGNGHKAAELGHVVLNEEGPLCGCGQRGCLEAFSSKTGMAEYIRQQIKRGRETKMKEAVSKGIFKSKAMKEAYQEGDAVMVEAVNRAAHYLSVACGSFINIFSPEIVVLGGGVMEAMGDVFLDKILSEVDKYVMPSIRSSVKICKAALEDDSILYGALALAEAYKKEIK